MAARFWVTGGTGNWNSTTNWSATTGGASGASVPSTADTATYDASSGAGTATLDISPTVQTLSFTGFTGTFAFGTNTITLNSTGTIFTGATTMTVTGTPQIICTAITTTASRQINPTAVTEANSISFRFTNGTAGISFGAGAIRNIDFTDGTNPTGYGGLLATFVVTIFGNLQFSTNMSVSSSTNTMTFAATSGTKTIDTAGLTVDRPYTFNGVGGTFQLQAALTSGATRTVTLTNGTLDLNGYTLTTGIFSSTNSNTRVLAFSTGKIVLTATSGGVFSTSVFANLTVTGTSLVQAVNGGAGTRTITFGTGAMSESNAINFDITSGSDIVSLFGTNGAAKNINFTGFTGTISIPNSKIIYGSWDSGSATSFSGTSNITFACTTGSKTIRLGGLTWPGNILFNGVGGTFVMQDAFTATLQLQMINGTLRLKAGVTSTVGSINTSGTNQKFLQSTTPGTQATLSDVSGTNSVDYLTIQDINATGGAVFNAFTSNFNVDSGNNTGWKFSNLGGNFLMFF